MPEVAVLGDLNLDIILKLPREPLPDTSVPAEDAYIALGGVGGNTSLWLKYLDRSIDTYLVTGVGDDIIGKELIDVLRRSGIRLKYVKVLRGVRSGVMVIMEYGGVKKIAGFRGANSLVRLSKEEMREALVNAKHLHASGYFALNSDGGELLVSLLQEAGSRGIPTSIDLEGIALMRPEFIHKIRGLVNYVLLNKSELTALIDSLNSSLEGIHGLLGCGSLIVKLGGKGALIYTGGSKELIKPKEVGKVVDPTGAGDAFNAALILSLIRGSSLIDAVRSGCVAGSEAVQVLGGSPPDTMLSQAFR